MLPGEKRAATLFLFPRNIRTHFCALIAKTPCPRLTLQSCPTRLRRTPTPDRYQGFGRTSALSYRRGLKALAWTYGCLCRASAGPPLASEAQAALEIALAPRPEVEADKAIRRSGTDSRGEGKGEEELWNIHWKETLSEFLALALSDAMTQTQSRMQPDWKARRRRTCFFPMCQTFIPPFCKVLPPSWSLCRATSAGSAGGQMKRMYSAVPGRVYVATRAHSAIGERELSLSKGDKVKGQFNFGSPIYLLYFYSTAIQMAIWDWFHIYSWVFRSVHFSVKRRRGGVLGRNGQRSHRMVPLRLCRRGG